MGAHQFWLGRLTSNPSQRPGKRRESSLQRCIILAALASFLLVLLRPTGLRSFTVPKRVAVLGASGRTGVLVVEELLRGESTEIRALTRDEAKTRQRLEEQLGPELAADERLRLVACDAGKAADVKKQCEGVDAAVWCVAGKPLDNVLSKAIAAFEEFTKQPPPDERGLKALGSLLAAAGSSGKAPPKIIMVSSAAVTRPTWSEGKKKRFAACADIPIVRLNPGEILDKKRSAEEVLRKSGASYSIVRPVGLNDDWPAGRPVLTQGDVAVGRISRGDLAKLVVSLLKEPEAAGKTFEAMAVAGYPVPAGGYGRVLAPLRRDDDPQGPVSDDEAFVTFELMQQLLPGEMQDSAALAMGQTYEQFDTGTEGKLGPRGEERVPSQIG